MFCLLLLLLLQQCHVMQGEMKALVKTRTWDVVKVPHGTHLVGFKWMYTIKYKLNESIERYKTILVAKEFSQKNKID